jgi:hypothetical protein
VYFADNAIGKDLAYRYSADSADNAIGKDLAYRYSADSADNVIGKDNEGTPEGCHAR